VGHNNATLIVSTNTTADVGKIAECIDLEMTVIDLELLPPFIMPPFPQGGGA